MNKLVLNSKKRLNKNLEVLEITGENTILEIEEKVEIDTILFPKETFETTWVLKKGTKAIICFAQKLENIDGKITIISEEKANLIFHMGIYASKKNHLEIKNIIEGNDCESDIKMRIAPLERSKFYLKATGVIKKNTKNSTYLEDIKYLSEFRGDIICLPELLVESEDSNANHNMTVAGVNQEDLFYLESRGLSKEKSREIICQNFVESMSRKDEYV